uniref:Eukaryotic translation initiation factor 3 subunit E n=1 Tax=Compsopogon caeruleus TaxID=31354 RepID=A0A7S1T814_9RHOD|mmetsp:Transcript_12729/g.25824  ORF Transcript_12729/g.25824 Transcript_12729/m.25824 type:complete len:445 (+) Transcript_12729:62-1396(+)
MMGMEGGYDLTHVIAQYLDRHMVIPLLEFAQRQGYYDPDDLLRAQLDLLSQTNMLDFAFELHRELYGGEPPVEMVERREKVLFVLSSLREDCAPIMDLLEDEELMRDLQEKKLFHLAHLQEEFNVNDEVLDALYEYGKFQFDCGGYAGASLYLSVYRTLLAGANPEKEFFALWGKFAADVLLKDWDAAMESLNQVKEAVDGQGQGRSLQFNPLQQLQHRTWIIHWGLFVFFNHPNGRNAVTDLLFQEKYLNTIQTNCPHILRYLTAAVIINKRRRNIMRDLVRVIQQESYTYHDPITEFVDCLCVNFDFEGAQDMLKKCVDTMRHDFFLSAFLDEFVENARLTIFETYCKIHNCIDITMLAEKLNMDVASAERWVVNLIRNARLDAKIDSQANQVRMGLTVPSVYEQIMESTKSLILRTGVIAQNYRLDVSSRGPGQTASSHER